MGDEIRVRVGVSNNVKAGMDGVVNDIEAGANRAAGRSGRVAGKGFSEAFMKVFRGDFSGALDDMNRIFGEKFKAAGESFGGKLVGGLTAAFAGYRGGQMLDRTFGISDKLGGLFAGRFGEQEDNTLAAFARARKAYRDSGVDLAEDEETMGESGPHKAVRKRIDQLQKAQESIRSALGSMTEAESGVAGKWIEQLDARIEKYRGVLSNIEASEQKIREIEGDTDGVKARQAEMRIEEDQRNRDIRRAQQVQKEGAFTAGLAARMIGRGDRGNEAQADYLTRRVFDRQFDREERVTDRAEKSMARRIESRERAAVRMRSNLSPEQLKRIPWYQRMMAAQNARAQADWAKQNLEQKQMQALDAQIESRKLQQKIADNTDAIADLKKLLVVGGGD